MAHAFTIITSSDETVVYTDYDAIDLTTLKHVISFKPDLGTLIESNEILLESDTIDVAWGASSVIIDSFITEPTLSTIEVELETGTSTGGLLLETGDDVRFEDETFSEEKTFTTGDNLVLDNAYDTTVLELETTGTFTGVILLETGDKLKLSRVFGAGFLELETTGTFTGGMLLETGDKLEFEAYHDVVAENAGGKILLQFSDGRSKLVPENFETGAENHLVLETASDTLTSNHYHAPVSRPQFESHPDSSEEHQHPTSHTEAEHREISLWGQRLLQLMAREEQNRIAALDE